MVPQIRPYEPADREAFLSLYADVWGTEKGQGWFGWRLEENPYRDGGNHSWTRVE